MGFKFGRTRTDKIPKEQIIKELRRVAELFNYRKFGWREFDEVSTLCKSYCVKRNFGSWNKALDSIGIPLKEKSKREFSNQDLFAEMERIWKIVGHRPSRIEWEVSQPNIGYNTYKKYFGTWTNACIKFIEYKTGESVQLELDKKPNSNTPKQIEFKPIKREKRDVPLRLRLRVLQRDGFKCVLCGRSPAFDKGTVLHVDHILPIAKGGKTTLANLQTLCKECNLGKSDKT
jgi:hypothetical protein